MPGVAPACGCCACRHLAAENAGVYGGRGGGDVNGSGGSMLAAVRAAENAGVYGGRGGGDVPGSGGEMLAAACAADGIGV